jgi:hypothetical protein
MDWNLIIAMLGVVVGVFLRAYYPFIKAKLDAEKAGEAISFKPKYMASAVVSIFVTGISALYALSAFSLPEEGGSLVFLLTFGLSYGYAFTSVMNLPLDAKNEVSKPG